MKYFKNDSIFQGIKEFDTPMGRIQAHNDGASWGIYVQLGNAFVRETTIERKEIDTCRTIWERWVQS